MKANNLTYQVSSITKLCYDTPIKINKTVAKLLKIMQIKFIYTTTTHKNSKYTKMTLVIPITKILHRVLNDKNFIHASLLYKGINSLKTHTQ